jgi:hypothetical protein
MIKLDDFVDFGYEKEWPGIVLDNNDPRKLGRCKITTPRFFGSIPVEDLPWAAPSNDRDGEEFIIPDVGKVVNIHFPNGDIYHPEYTQTEHYNINLQNKLESLTETAYQQFKALSFDANFQFYTENEDEGMVLDYVKSKMQIRPNGDVIINLRDNASTMYLGSEGADQSALLGDRWIKWFDKFMKNMIGQFGGPYLGNMTAPVIANPAMLQVCNEYFAVRQAPAQHFLSDRIKVVDNDKVEANRREFDQVPEADQFLINEKENEISRQRTYQPSNAPTSTGSSVKSI